MAARSAEPATREIWYAAVSSTPEACQLQHRAPPVTTEHALRVAAEYAEQIRGENSWWFWWD